MQVVIDLQDDIYRTLCLSAASITSSDIALSVRHSIANGVPLPKGHGRIADVDEAIKCIEDVEGDDAIWAISLIEWACSKRTIVEADTESEYKE